MLVTVARYSFPYEAHLGRARLESENIPAFVADEHTINMQWLYSDAMGGVRLQVPEAFQAEALAVLGETAAPLPDNEENTCPTCGSHKLSFYQFGRRWAFLVFLGIHFPLYPVRSGFKCEDCGRKIRA